MSCLHRLICEQEFADRTRLGPFPEPVIFTIGCHAGEHFVNCLIEIVPACRRDDQRRAIRDQMDAFVGLARENLNGRSLKTVEQAASRLDRCLIDCEACIPRCRVDIRSA